jgi:hypothetical protein
VAGVADGGRGGGGSQAAARPAAVCCVAYTETYLYLYGWGARRAAGEGWLVDFLPKFSRVRRSYPPGIFCCLFSMELQTTNLCCAGQFYFVGIG